ncbi:MAG: hypothetical protein NVS4B3_08720 [Gemmatimonadaceae bacterium]
MTGAFVVRLGADTIAVERYRRSSSRLEGDVVVRAPRTRVGHYTADLRPDGGVSRFDFEIHAVSAATSAPRSQRVALVFAADSITIRSAVDDSATTRRIAAPGATLPYFASSLGLTELLTTRAVAARSDTTDLTIIPVGAAQLFPVRVIRIAPDSLTIAVAGSTTPARARVDTTGRLLGQQALASTQKFVVERLASVNVDSLASAFASREMGPMSPKDSVAATIGAAHVSVVYSRPVTRRRVIFGGIVPFNEVWRTGANAATVFRSDAPLTIGGRTIPAGAYTLWTIPRRDGWTLIINKQVGQWGTEYKADQDLARIPMQTAPIAPPVERFTIGFRPQEGSAALEMSWDTTRASIAVTAP